MSVEESVWLPIVTFVMGGVITHVGEAIRDHRRWRRRLEDREAKLRVLVAERKLKRRRAVLNDLKKATSNLRRLALNTTPDDPESAIHWLNKLSESETNILVISESIGDEALQEYIGSFIEASKEFTQAVAYNARNVSTEEFDALYVSISQRIGQLLFATE